MGKVYLIVIMVFGLILFLGYGLLNIWLEYTEKRESEEIKNEEDKISNSNV